MPRWQRGYASGCRPEDGSSNIRYGRVDKGGEGALIVNLPRGSKILFMLSGGIDSPVAIKLAKKYFSVMPLHFTTSLFQPRYYKQRFREFLEVVMEKLELKKVMVVPFSDVLKKISISGKRKYSCLLCRKAMLKACELICYVNGYDAIGTGEVLAQKASQTIYNMQATHYGLKKPVIHPLLCLDKEEIVKLARRFGISIEKHLGTCRLVPRYPVTRASPEKLEKMYSELELDKGVKEAVEKAFWIKEAKEFEEVVE